MVNDELRNHALPDKFPERIRLLLGLPRPLEIEGHPVREMWRRFKSCFPDFQEVELDEICENRISIFDVSEISSIVYPVDDHRILRYDLTSQLAERWIKGGGGPCRLVSVGRVFRASQRYSATTLEVHHQAEILWTAPGLDMGRFEETMIGIAGKLMPGVEFELQSVEPGYPFVKEERHYWARWRDHMLKVAAGGLVRDDWLEKAGLDPAEYGGIGLAFGLERSALVAMDLDDARALWQEPYVPEGK